MADTLVSTGMKQILTLVLLGLSLSIFSQDVSLIPSDSIADAKHERPKREKKIRKDTSDIIKQPIRVEIPVENTNDEFDVIEGYEDGLLVVQNTNEPMPKGSVWKFYFVNNDLHLEWTLSQMISDRSILLGSDYSNGLYFLFFDNAYRYKEYQLLIVDVSGERMQFLNFELPFDVELEFFEAIDDGILLVGYYASRPVAMIHNLVTGTPKILPGFYNHNERVFDLVMDDESQAFSIVLAEKMRNGKHTNRIKSFTFEGILISENLINPGENWNLIDGTTTKLGSGVQYMAGTYSVRNTIYGTGMYLAKFTNGQQKYLRNHNFGDFSNFFAYRGERASERIQKRVSRKKARGRMPKFKYQLFIHEIFSKGDVNILVAEAYYPRYASGTSFGTSGISNPYYGSSYYGYNSYRYTRVFMGYKYTHAVVMAFDSKGAILWDNSFKTNDITSYNLEESVAVNVQGDKAVIMYLDDGDLKSKVVEGDEVLEGKTYNPIKLLHPGDKEMNRDNEISGVRNWYENYLYSFGIQKVKNKTFPRKERKRRVFYINKIQFDEAVPDYPDARLSSR